MKNMQKMQNCFFLSYFFLLLCLWMNRIRFHLTKADPDANKVIFIEIALKNLNITFSFVQKRQKKKYDDYQLLEILDPRLMCFNIHIKNQLLVFICCENAAVKLVLTSTIRVADPVGLYPDPTSKKKPGSGSRSYLSFA